MFSPLEKGVYTMKRHHAGEQNSLAVHAYRERERKKKRKCSGAMLKSIKFHAQDLVVHMLKRRKKFERDGHDL